jgi:hypothetical protein
VQIRDREVPGEYKRTVAKMDRSLGHDNGDGPVTRRLTEYGGVMPLCFGGHSEGSEEVHNPINILATTRLKKVGLQRGRLALIKSWQSS